MNHQERPKQKPHPKEKMNCLGDILFLYIWKLFMKGFRKELSEEDLYEVHKNYRSKQEGDKFEKEWDNQKTKTLYRTMWKCYGYYYLFLGFCDTTIKSSILVLQPYCIGKFVSYFSPNVTENALTKNDAYFYAFSVIFLNFFNSLYQNNYHLRHIFLGLQCRAALCSLIYRSILRKRLEQFKEISIGNIVTLLTKDMDALEVFIDFFNEIWIGFLRMFVICFVLYRRIGNAAFVGVAVLLVVVPLQVYCATRITKIKTEMCRKSDERLQIMQQSLSAIKIIKMFTWEKVFEKKIAAARREEIRTCYNIFFLKISIVSIGYLTSQIALYFLIATYVWLGNATTAEIIYYIITCFQTLSNTLTITFPGGIWYTAELVASVRRCENVLKALETDTNNVNETESTIIDKYKEHHTKIVLDEVSVGFENKEILHNINLNINYIKKNNKDNLWLVTGAVGSGKSVLLKTILKDYSSYKGQVMVQGRISYASQEPWLFPSTIRQNILFGEKFNETRYQKVLEICALVYDFSLFPDSDRTVVEDRGINLSKGQQARINLARAVYRDSEIYLLDDCLSSLDINVASFIFEKCIKKFLKDKLVILVSQNMERFIPDVDYVVVMSCGRIKYCGTDEKLLKTEEKNLVVSVTENGEKCQEAEMKNGGFDIDGGEEDMLLKTDCGTGGNIYQEYKQSGKVDFSVYKRYFQFGGGLPVVLFLVGVFALAQFAVSYMDKLVSNWVNLEEEISNHTSAQNFTKNSTEYENLLERRTRLFYMYTLMTISVTVGTFARGIFILLCTKKASVNLHKHIVHSILHATMNFFDTHFIGNILNRFSKDMMIMDLFLPFILYGILSMVCAVTGVVILIASVNATFLIPAVIFYVILDVLRRFCLKAFRNLQRLSASTRSPMVGHLNATLEGLTTIRASRCEETLKNEFDRHQDLCTSADYILYSSMKGFQFTLDCLCGLLIAVVVLKFVIFEDETLAGSVGLAVSQALQLAETLQWGIKELVHVENQMTCVERILECSNAIGENQQGLCLENWPKRGQIKFVNVFLRYNSNSKNILRNINFTAESGEKIGIVGRTGAGKSSIISSLFRLYEVEGKICIDGVDIKTISLELLRSKIGVIPQDPVLFTGTIRENLDLKHEHSDIEIWKALETVNLKPLISSLDFQILQNGANFSVGQRQLVCLARALVKNYKIIVLDEATANIDPETDVFVQEVISKSFRECTVFIVAHKLHSVVKCDKILVLDGGEILEFGDPKSLIAEKRGYFYKMLKSS